MAREVLSDPNIFKLVRLMGGAPMMRGLFSPLQEVSLSLEVKLNGLAAEVGVKTVKEMGYPTKRNFLEEKYRTFLESLAKRVVKIPKGHGSPYQGPIPTENVNLFLSTP